MKRQTILLTILAVLVLIGLPVTYMDRKLLGVQAQAEAAMEGLEPLRKEAAAVRQQEAELVAGERVLSTVTGRVILKEPFATIQGELAVAAQVGGVVISNLTLEGPAAVPDLPQLVRYRAVLHLSGTQTQYLDFLQRLESHRLLIEIPDAALRLLPPAQKGGPPRVEQVLTLGFFAAANP